MICFEIPILNVMFCIHQPIPKVLIFSSVELWPWMLLWIIFNVPQPQLKKQVFQESPLTWLLVSYRKIKKLSLKVLDYIEIWTKVFCLHYISVNLTNDLFMVFLRIIKKTRNNSRQISWFATEKNFCYFWQ